jgi:tetratricopeptide (TPR) repeat protein
MRHASLYVAFATRRLRPSALVIFFLLSFSLTLAIPSVAQQKPMTKDQVQGLVQNQLGDETGAKAIEQRGIDFEPTEDFIQSLRKAGANEAFIAAVRAGRPAVRPAEGAKKPLSQFQVLSLLSSYVSSARIAQLVSERGIDFDPTDDYLEVVQKNGGKDDLLTAIRQAKVIKAPTADPAVSARQAQIQQFKTRASSLSAKGQHAAAEKELRSALELDPNDSNLHAQLGVCLREQNKINDALSELLAATRLDPDNEGAHTLLAITLFQKGDVKGSIPEYREALRVDPENDQLHILLGRAIEQSGDRKQAIAEYREAVRLNPDRPQGHVMLSAALLQEGDVENSLTEAGEAVRLDPNEPSYKKLYDAIAKMKKSKKK